MAIATDDATAIRAAAGGAEKRAYVRQIFSEIAPRYDLLNHVLSFNIDRGWRRKAIAEFGIRNVADLDACLIEVRRVLEPGGRFVILEFSKPSSSLLNAAYQQY